MPDHVHLILTPNDISLERVVQFIKGGFSFRATRELNSVAEIWQPGFTDHRIRDAEDYERERDYLLLNPMRAGLCGQMEDYPYSSAHPGFDIDDVPQRLKPAGLSALRHG
jgi:putative transposase